MSVARNYFPLTTLDHEWEIVRNFTGNVAANIE
jgi:hypothetical protein